MADIKLFDIKGEVKELPSKQVVPIPIKADKTFDVEKQRALAQKYATIDSIKNDVYKQIADLTSITVI